MDSDIALKDPWHLSWDQRGKYLSRISVALAKSVSLSCPLEKLKGYFTIVKVRRILKRVLPSNFILSTPFFFPLLTSGSQEGLPSNSEIFASNPI
jgi:hypothetical protein